MSSKLVCVTGASGFIGTHLVRKLLEEGHRVRATVRDPEDPSKCDHLRKLPGAEERLELHRADLLEPGSFDEPIRGCDWVCHVAASVKLNARDPQREIVDVAVKGTENVLAAIDHAGGVSRVGLTSSIAAVGRTQRHPDHTYTEDDWNDDATLETNPYGLAKTLSERAVWSHREGLASEKRYDLTVVNPSLVLGPLYVRSHVRSSPSVVRDIMRGSFKGCPPLAFALVDVRDVVNALSTGLEKGITGRFILNTDSWWMRDIAQVVAKAHPELNVPTRRLPALLLYLVALFDKRVSLAYVRRNAHRKEPYSGEKAQRELGAGPYPLDQSIKDTCASLLELGLV